MGRVFEIPGINQRREKIQQKLEGDNEIDSDLCLEALILLSFDNHGQPRNFPPLEVRNILKKHKFFKLILEEGFGDE